MSTISDICHSYKSIDPIPRDKERILFSQYRYFCDRLGLLDKEDPEHLQIESKIQDLQTKVVQANIRFVCVVSRPFSLRYKIEIEDIVAEGTVGLLRAMEKYNVDANTRFISYAVYWIRNHIERSLEQAHIIRLNYGVIRNVEGFKRDRQRIEQVLEKSIALREVVERDNKHTTKPTWNAETWDLIESPVISLDSTPTSTSHSDEEFGQSISLLQRIADPDPIDPLASRADEERRSLINTLLDRALDYKERKAIEWFYGLNGNPKRTCEVIARDLNYSRQRISQLLEQAERKLMRHARTFGLIKPQ